VSRVFDYEQPKPYGLTPFALLQYDKRLGAIADNELPLEMVGKQFNDYHFRLDIPKKEIYPDLNGYLDDVYLWIGENAQSNFHWDEHDGLMRKTHSDGRQEINGVASVFITFERYLDAENFKKSFVGSSPFYATYNGGHEFDQPCLLKRASSVFGSKEVTLTPAPPYEGFLDHYRAPEVERKPPATPQSNDLDLP
tara:strand:- start:7001 stop:7585 length:585 start_codon:yes stop_codon:yes gene_type:complete